MTARRRLIATALVAASGLLVGCGGSDEGTASDRASTTASTTTEADTTTTTTTAASSTASSTSTPSSTTVSSTTSTAPDADRDVPVVIESQVDDLAQADVAATIIDVLTDERGWARAGFRFREDADAPYRIVVAEPADVDAACAPYETAGRYSCQIGPVVMLNADRWRSGVAHWTGTIAEYRTMLINHEVGHLLGQHHPATTCPTPGEPALVMATQSKGLSGCTANPWPLEGEIRCAASGVEPMAPPYESDPEPACEP